LRLTPLLNLPAPGRRQTLYVVFDLAESCVFDKQSPGPFHCNPLELREQVPTPLRAHLIPKLRCQFAEFLRIASLERLRIFSLSTCVGFRYGFPPDSLEVCLGSVASVGLRLAAPHRFSTSALNQRNGFAYPSRLRAWPYTSNGRDHLASCVTPSVFIARKEVQEC
jgi:hypothetical protein